MSKEKLRMQMLAGVITESQYKTSLNEMESTTTVGKLLQMIGSVPANAFISLNYDGGAETEVKALNYIDMEGLDNEEPEIILVGETEEDHMTVGELKSKLSTIDPSTYVTLNLDLENGTEVVSNIQIDTEMMNDEEQPEIILF
jgi:hypothetical protein